MLILHTSDWHLGRTDAERSLAEDQQFFIDAIAEIVQTRGVDAVIVAGDVFDRAIAPAEAIRLYDDAMRRICIGLRVPVLIVAGNHDSAARLASCRDLLSAAGLHVCGALTREPAVVRFDDTDVYLLPWITEEKVKSVYPEEAEAVRSPEDAYRVVTAHLRETFAPEKRHIAVAHAFLTAAETSGSDLAAEIGTATQVGAGVFEGFDYVALGHIHKPQDVGERARYSGTPMPYSFGKEEAQVKSVTLIDTADMTRETVPLPLKHRRATLTGTLEELLAHPCGDETRLGYVKLEVTDCHVGTDAINSLQEVYPNALDIRGLQFSDTADSITLTAEELEALADDPVAVFRRFYTETQHREPTEHMTALFAAAVKRAEEATDE